MKTTIIIIILSIAALCYAVTIDNNCISQCMAKGYSYDICARMCTY